MDYALTFCRDTLTLNIGLERELRMRLSQSGAASALPVLIAARDLRVAGGFQLEGHDLVLLADQLDGSAGHIRVVSGPAMAGQRVTVGCRTLRGLKLTVPGGDGAAGRAGAPGKPGTPGKSRGLGKPGWPGGDGGPGGPGGRGGDGGQGGEIELRYLQDAVPGGFQPARDLQVPGGKPGPGGPGGPGGRGGHGGSGEPDGEPGEPGPAGPAGPPGTPGAAGHYVLQALPEDLLYEQIRPMAEPWVAYRLRMGTFYFRSFAPGDASTAGCLDAALTEFDRVLSLRPGDAQAAQLRSQLLNNQNVLGLPRDFDLQPDYALWESSYLQYRPILTELYTSAENMLVADVGLAEKRSSLDLQIKHLEGLDGVLETELQTAQAALRAAGAEVAAADQWLTAMQEAVRKKQEELVAKAVDIGGLLTNFAAVGAAILAIGGGGAALISIAPTLVAIGQDIGDKDLVHLLKDKQALEKLGQDAGGLKKVVEGGKGVVSLVKAVNDIFQLPPQDAEYKELMRELVKAVGDQKVAQLRKSQAALAVKAATARKELSTSDLQLAHEQARTLTDEIHLLRDVAMTLYRSAQRYMDTLVTWAFKAARAVEIITLQDKSDVIRYDYGFINPDHEEELSWRDDAQSLIELMAEYRISLAGLAGTISYRADINDWESGGLQTGWKYVHITDPAVIQTFAATHHLSFRIDLPDLLPSWREVNVEAVKVALAGATSVDPEVTVLLRHSGGYDMAMRDGSVRHLVLQPWTAEIDALKSALQEPGEVAGPSPRGLGFWRHGIAASYDLYIEDAEIQSNAVDLQTVTEITVAIEGVFFLAPGTYRVTSIAKDTAGDVSALRCVNTGSLDTVALRAAAVIPLLRSGKYRFYAEEPGGTRLEVEAVSRPGRAPYLAAVRDGVPTSDLHKLPVFDRQDATRRLPLSRPLGEREPTA
jgi:hypothetical protein